MGESNMEKPQVMPKMPNLQEMAEIANRRTAAYLSELDEKFRRLHVSLSNDTNLSFFTELIKRKIELNVSISTAMVPTINDILNLPGCQAVKTLAKLCNWSFELKEVQLPNPNTGFIWLAYEVTLRRLKPKTKTLFIFQYHWNSHKMPARGKILIIADDLPAAEELAGVGNTSPIAGEGYTGYCCEQQIPLDDDVNLSLVL